jgi:hypothetical protein
MKLTPQLKEVRMLQQLDKKYPMGGPSWVNWTTVFTGIILAVVTASMWFLWDELTLAYSVVHEVPAKVDSNTEAIAEIRSEGQQAQQKLDEIIGLLKQKSIRDETLTGRLRIVTNGGHGTGPCLWINELSAASIHIKTKRLRVVNLSDPDRRSGIINIKGTISTSANILGDICETAAQMLKAETGLIHVRMEPVSTD